jgi:hypothetical protein
MHTRKCPRTVEEAFGPFNRSSACRIVPMSQAKVPARSIALYIGAVLAAGVATALWVMA